MLLEKDYLVKKYTVLFPNEDANHFKKFLAGVIVTLACTHKRGDPPLTKSQKAWELKTQAEEYLRQEPRS